MISDFRVGRGTLREALRILEVNGFLTLKPGPGGGPIVEGLQDESFGRMATLFFQMGGMTYRELVEARLIMEPVAARLAAERQREAKAPKGLEIAASVEDIRNEQEYLLHTSDFHAAVTRSSGNGIVSLFCQSLADVYRERVRGVLFPVDRRGEVVAAHAAIARAISSGNGSRAEKLMREHMEEYASYVFERHPAIMDEIVEWR